MAAKDAGDACGAERGHRARAAGGKCRALYQEDRGGGRFRGVARRRGTALSSVVLLVVLLLYDDTSDGAVKLTLLLLKGCFIYPFGVDEDSCRQESPVGGGQGVVIFCGICVKMSTASVLVSSRRTACVRYNAYMVHRRV